MERSSDVCSSNLEKISKDIRNYAPISTVISWTVQRKPYGGNHEAIANASVNARYTFSGDALSTLWNDTLFSDITSFLVSYSSGFSVPPVFIWSLLQFAVNCVTATLQRY